MAERDEIFMDLLYDGLVERRRALSFGEVREVVADHWGSADDRKVYRALNYLEREQRITVDAGPGRGRRLYRALRRRADAA